MSDLTLNGEPITEQELEARKKKLLEENIQLIESSPGEYKTRLRD